MVTVPQGIRRLKPEYYRLPPSGAQAVNWWSCTFTSSRRGADNAIEQEGLHMLRVSQEWDGATLRE